MAEHATSRRSQMVADLFCAVDSKDTEGLLSFIAPDGTQRFGNQEPLRGHGEIRAANEAFFGMIKASNHEITGLWEAGDTVVVRLDATYWRDDGLAVTVPAVTIFEESDGLIVEYAVFVDMAPVFAST